MFIGRKQELSALEQMYSEDKFQCVIVYGRRRVGKTTLLSHFAKDKCHVIFSAKESTSKALLREFIQKIYTKIGLDISACLNWESAFEAIGEYSKDKQLVLVMDEFPYLARADKSIKSMLQNLIDHKLQETKLFLILCGSQVSFMEKEVLGYNSPLYGRRTAQMKVQPFTFAESKDFFKNYSIEEQIQAYSILGGVPLYLGQFDDRYSIEDNIKTKILQKNAYLYEEPKNLLKQELREPMNYNAIIEAIASGASSMNTIVGKSKINADQCSKYLHVLSELLLVQRELPVGETSSSRKGIYKLQDSFFYFWYKFLFPNLSDLEMDMADEIMEEEIIPHLPAFVGHVFEDICHQHFLQEMKNKRLPYRFSHLGRWWGNNPVERCQEEIDIFAKGKQGIYLGECKWRNELLGEDVLHSLQRRGKQLFSHEERITYVLYSKSGFSLSVHEYAAQNKDVLLYELKDF